MSLNFNINGPIVIGRLVLDSALVNVTLDPSVVTVNYTQILSPSQNTYTVFPTSTYTCLPSPQPVIISTEYLSMKASTTTITITNTTTTTITIEPTQTKCIIPGALITKISTTSIIKQYATQTIDSTVNFNIRTTSEVLLYPSGCPSNLTIGSSMYIGGGMSALIVLILLVVMMFCCYTYGKRNGKRRFAITNDIANENPIYQFNPYQRPTRVPWHRQNVQQNQDAYLGVYRNVPNQQENLQYEDLKCPRIPLPPLPSKDQDNAVPTMSEKDEIYDDLNIQEMYVEMKSSNQ